MVTSAWFRTLLRSVFALPLLALPAQGIVVSVNLIPSANPVRFGSSLTLVANVTPATISGSVVFFDGTTILGYGTLNSGQAQLAVTGLVPGTHKLHVFLPGDPHLTPTVVTETVNALPGGGFYPSAASPISVGTTPQSIAVASFVHGDPADMAVVNQGDSTVSVFRGDSVGGFNAVPNSPFAAGSIRRAVAVGDFNGDGNLDMAVAGGGLNANATVTILIGDGSGGFTPATGSPFAAGGNGPTSIAVADFNGDGKEDLAIGTLQNATVLIGNGDGTFQTPTTALSTGSRTDVTAGDFNGDGNADLAVAYGTSGGFIAILNGDGAGAFTAATGSPVAFGTTVSGANSLVTGDFDGDGKADLAVADSFGNTVTVLLGNGASAFAAAPGSPFSADSSPASLAMGDFNGDGIPDLAIAETNGIEVEFGRGNGSFSQPFGSPYAAGTTPSSIAVADFNGDGVADLAVSNSGSNNLTVLLAYPSVAITFDSVTPNPASFGQQITVLARVLPSNATGSLTFYDGVTILGSAPIASGLAVFKTVALAPGQHSLTASYVGTGAYRGGTSPAVIETVSDVTSTSLNPVSSGPVSAGTSPSAVVSGDFNGDGNADLAVANKSDNTVTILLGNGSGGFTASTGSPFPAGTSPSGMAVGDFNEDGKSDLVIADRVSGNNITVLLGDGNGGFTAATGSPFASSLNLASSVAVADINGDRIADLAVGGAGARALVGDGNGGFTLAGFAQPAGAIGTASVAFGDFNGDGSPDVVSDSTGTIPYVSLWIGPAGFTGNIAGTSPAGPGLAVGDLNGDGKTDFVGASSADNTVRMFIGDGAGGFTFAGPYSPFLAGSKPAAVALGDFNGDGKVDITVANSGDGTVSVFLNGGFGNFSAMTGSPFQAGGTPVSLAVADFNGDGRMDIAVANSGSNNLTILLGASQPQTIAFAPLPNVPVTTAPFQISATATSGMTVSFASNTTNVCTVSGTTVTILISGGCSITATQTGGAGYLAAPQVTQKFTVLYNDVDSSLPPSQVAAIDLFAQYGITAGCGNNDFCPNAVVTRAQMAIFVIRSIFGGNVFPYSTTPHFGDVAPTDFGFQYIQAMYELGITSGCNKVGSVVNYCPTLSVSRLQMAVFIIRARLGPTATFNYPSTAYFTDVLPTSNSYSYVQRMRLDGITAGCNATMYCPDAPVTRAQMAIFVIRALFNQELAPATLLITQISPATLITGATNTYTITGSNTNFVQGTTTLAPIPGVTIGTITVNSATSMTVQLTAGSGVGTQPYTIDAITGSEEAVLPNALSVVAPPI